METKTLNSNLIPINTSYLGNNIFKGDDYITFTGYQMNMKGALKSPVDYSIGRDVFLALTDYKNYDDIFSDLRDNKTSVANKSLSAFALNDFTSKESLSAMGEEGSSSGALDGSIIGFSDDDGLVKDTIDYSFNSTIRFNNIYWVDNNDILSSDTSPENLTDDHYFYFSILNQSQCNIIKSGESGEKYLTYSTATSSLSFSQTEDINNSRFFYSYNSDESFLILITNDGAIGFDPETGDITVTNLSSTSLSSDIATNLLAVDYKNELNLNEPIQNSFLVDYSNKNSIDSQYDVDNNYIISHLYNSESTDNTNLITLKNNVSLDGEYSLINVGGTASHRDYTGLNTGIRGDTGFSNIIPVYKSNMFKVDFTPDKRTYFNIPYELDGYSKININDCKLINNGAIGGSSPLNSDKIYKKLYEYKNFKNTGDIDNTPNGQYLCSWLWFNPLRPSQSIWLDRYYNPDRVTQLNALSVDGWNTIKDITSYLDTSELSAIYGDYMQEFDKEIGVFDVESQLTIQPNALYIYERIGKQVSEKLHNKLSSLELIEVNETKFDFNNSIEVAPKDTSNDQEFTISLVLDNFNINTFKGNRIFGNNTIALSVDRYFSPYTASVSGENLYFYDYDYNLITSVNVSSTINDVIFTDDYNTIYVELTSGEIYTVENLDFITNSTDALTSKDINHITYSDNLLYYLESNGLYSSFNPNSEFIIPIDNGTVGDDLLLVYNGKYSTYKGEYVDYSDDGSAYILSGNEIRYNDISTPIITGDSIKDMVVDSDDIVYVLKDDSLVKADNSFLTKSLTSVNIVPDNALDKVIMGRYIRNGVVSEYLDVVDTGGLSSTKIRRYDKNLNLLDTISKPISGTLIKSNSAYFTKYLDRKLELEITLFNIFNYIKLGKIRLDIPERFVEEDDLCILNFVFSNKYGSINVYCNGEIIDIYKFDANKYYFSNTLRDTKLFLGSSSFNTETTISESILSSDNDMISGNYSIKEFKIYDGTLDYFDVLNINRIYRDTGDCSLVLPIKHRSYIDEISGMNIQTKNLRKSEYGSIVLKGSDLTDKQEANVKQRIDKLFEDTYINLRVSETKIT